MTTTADPAAHALARLYARPYAAALWRGVQRRDAVLPDLPRTVLLHAGPPYASAAAVPAPVRNAAIQAVMFEGLAPDAEAAGRLLAGGDVTLAPAQDYGVATPLAQVVSASMPLAVVGDGASVAYAPLIEGPPPALRFGTRDAAAQTRLAAVAACGLDALDGWLREHAVAMGPLIAEALANGDDCHGRTVAANAALVTALAGLKPEALAVVGANAGFVLPILMATACWHLRRQASGIAAAGGNGVDFGMRLHRAAAWQTVPAAPPVGIRLPGHDATVALGAIGDSAVIDFGGLGGQALMLAPALRADWQQWLPADLATRRASVTDAVTGIVDAGRAREAACVPIVNLAILDEAGDAGLIGRGFYAPPSALFG
ncbi:MULTISPECIES: oxamate carbamoyltransferase subunit AllG family protein [unclassified Cupriavidus]|uniref:oxamate carbamoyltransferase subunit AllG family protein n=1 Tax=unclassified Cupriavidus TaxID=2640874 RepID=UPI00313DE837